MESDREMREPIGIRYYKIVRSEKYLAWQTEILKKIYNDFSLIKLGEKEYPIVCFEPMHDEKDKERITTNYDLLTDIEMYDIQKSICKNFGEIVKPHMHYKDELAYMLHKMEINDQGYLEWFSTKVSDYEQTMFTSNILEYELYKYYRATRGEVPNVSRAEILDNLPLRKSIHGNHSQFYTLTHGEGRNAEISIQMFYTFYDKDKMSYVFPCGEVPKNAATKQGRFQFFPEGGYRLRNRRLADNEGLFMNYKLDVACNRIFLEQIYGHKEIHSRDNLIINPNENIILNSLNKSKRNKKAFYDMLGMTIDLVTLRPTVSFILRVDEEDYNFRKGLSSNNEEMKIEVVALDDIKKYVLEKNITNESAGMYYLLNKNRYYRNILRVLDNVD